MRALFCSSIGIAALLCATAPAWAMPAAPSAALPGEGWVLVRDGCGPFGHRSHYGYCKDNEQPELTYQPGEGRRGGYGGYEDRPRPRFFEEDGYRERRCFIRETYDGPVRVCR